MSPHEAGEISVTQPVPAPVYLREYQQLLLANVLVDRAGRPLRSGRCPTCDSLIDGYTCPGSLPCPRCRAGPTLPAPQRTHGGPLARQPHHGLRGHRPASCRDERLDAACPLAVLTAPTPRRPARTRLGTRSERSTS